MTKSYAEATEAMERAARAQAHDQHHRQRAIRAELYRMAAILGAGSDLLAILGGWGDVADDEETFAMLRGWNETRGDPITARLNWLARNGLRSVAERKHLLQREG